MVDPSVNHDVFGVAVDPISGNIYVSQDSAPQELVEFMPNGTMVRSINVAGISSDPDGLAYDVATDTFYFGDDTDNSIYHENAAGMTLNSWNLTNLNISPEGLGIDPANGHLYIGEGFQNRMVYVVSGIVPPNGICQSGPAQFQVSVTTTGIGDALVILNNVPPGTIEGWTLFTLDTSTPVGGGPNFGATPDLNTLAIFSIARVAMPGDPLHWTWPVGGGVSCAPIQLAAGNFCALQRDFLGPHRCGDHAGRGSSYFQCFARDLVDPKLFVGFFTKAEAVAV